MHSCIGLFYWLKNVQVVQHFIHCIESHGRQVQYLRFLHAIVKAESQYVRKTQDIVMAELVNMGEDVLLFYNDRCVLGSIVIMTTFVGSRFNIAC